MSDPAGKPEPEADSPPAFDLAGWWPQRQAEGKTPIEAAREFGVDIEQLRYLRSRTPSVRLRHLESMLEFVLEGRAAIQRQKAEKRRHG